MQCVHRGKARDGSDRAEGARVHVNRGVALAPNARAAAALAHVLGFGRILAVLLAHRAAHPPPRRQLGQESGSLGLGQLASLHHLPQQHTSTADHVSKEHARLSDGVRRVAGAEDLAAAAAACWACAAAMAAAVAAVVVRVARVAVVVVAARAVSRQARPAGMSSVRPSTSLVRPWWVGRRVAVRLFLLSNEK